MKIKTWPLARRLQALCILAAVLDLGLAVYLFSPWAPSQAHAQANYAVVKQRYESLRREAGEIARLERELDASRGQMRAFVSSSMPKGRLMYSTIMAELNRLATKQQVVLSGLNFGQQEHSHAGLRGVYISGDLSGPYAGLMHYLNAVERDPIFFQIQKVSLSHRSARHSSNTVRLHIWLATYARVPQTNQTAAPRPEEAPQQSTP